MAYWLLKTEPDAYSWDDLARDKKATWDGVANATALKHIREMKKGDTALIYHTGDERAAIGVAEITSAPYPNPKEEDERLVVVRPESQGQTGSACNVSRDQSRQNLHRLGFVAHRPAKRGASAE